MRHALSIVYATLLCGLFFPLKVLAEVSVIVHPDTPVRALTAEQVSDIYLGRSRSFDRNNSSNMARITLLEQPDTSPIRAAFYRTLNGMSISRVTTYWARLRFSGQFLPPETLPDSRAILDRIKTDRSAIGYIESQQVDHSVKVVLRLQP